MKKILDFLLSLIMFALLIVRVSANEYQVSYSEWSSEYPTGINPILIRSEERYLWYQEKYVNGKYMTKKEAVDTGRKVAYSDFIFTEESPLLDERPEGIEYRVINEVKVPSICGNEECNVTKYTYIDKLFKCYEIENDITEDYYTELPGYEKLESSKKTFYRYITDEVVYMNSYGEVLDNWEECVKGFCRALVVKKEESPKEEENEEIPVVSENPKTIDKINIFTLIFIISLVSLIVIFKSKLIYVINLVLSNRFKKAYK